MLRGSEAKSLIERAVLTVPPDEAYTVSDLRIDGVPMSDGAQVAEQVAVNTVGRGRV